MAPSVAGICVHLSVFCGITFANGMVVQEILGGLCWRLGQKGEAQWPLSCNLMDALLSFPGELPKR